MEETAPLFEVCEDVTTILREACSAFRRLKVKILIVEFDCDGVSG